MSKTADLRASVRRLALGPGWVRYGVLLGWGVVLSLASWWLLLEDLQQNLSPNGAVQQIEAAKQAERVAAVQKGEQRLALAREQQLRLSVLAAALPSANDAQSAWATVHQASRKHGLRMELFKPGPVGSEKPYPQQRANLRVSGNFQDVLSFTRTLALAGKPVAFESFSVAGGVRDLEGPGNNRLVLEAVLLSLHQPAVIPVTAPTAPTAPTESPTASMVPLAWAPSLPSVAAPTVIAPMASTVQPILLGGDPFESRRLSDASSSAAPALAASMAAAEVATPAQALHSSPLASMRLVGSVQSAGQKTALVMAGGMLHSLRVGDALGNARGRVVDIRAGELTVQEPSGEGAAQPGRVVVLSLSKD